MRRVNPTIGYFTTIHLAMIVAMAAAASALLRPDPELIPQDSALGFRTQRFDDGSRLSDLSLGEPHQSGESRISILEEAGQVIAVTYAAPNSTAVWTFLRTGPDTERPDWLASFTAYVDDEGRVVANAGDGERVRIFDDNADGSPDRRVFSALGTADISHNQGWSQEAPRASVEPGE